MYLIAIIYKPLTTRHAEHHSALHVNLILNLRIISKIYLVQVVHLQKTANNHYYSEQPCLKVDKLIQSRKSEF